MGSNKSNSVGNLFYTKTVTFEKVVAERLRGDFQLKITHGLVDVVNLKKNHL